MQNYKVAHFGKLNTSTSEGAKRCKRRPGSSSEMVRTASASVRRWHGDCGMEVGRQSKVEERKWVGKSLKNR